MSNSFYDYSVELISGDKITFDKYKGKKVIMNLNGPLEKDQTYIISINKNLEDEHNVRLKESKQVAFSTGSYIDDGSISGKVYSSD